MDAQRDKVAIVALSW